MVDIARTQRSEKEQLQPLLDFLNTEIDGLDEPGFITLVWNYMKFLEQSDQLLNDTQTKFHKFIEGLPERPGANTLMERKKIFKELQKHLRSKIEKVIRSTEQGEPSQDKVLTTLLGTRIVVVDTDSDQFLEEFVPKIPKSADKIDMKEERATAETVFVDMLRNYGMKPTRFSFCVKRGCNNLLYKFDLRQEYCSDRCSGADRQKRYLSEQKDKNKKPKKGRKG